MEMQTTKEYLDTHPNINQVASTVLDELKDLTPSEAIAVLEVVKANLGVAMDDFNLRTY